MKIRRYIGNNTQEAILKVKMDLGNDAVILNTRKVRQKGLFKLFAKPLVEVLAAIDENQNQTQGGSVITRDNSRPGKDRPAIRQTERDFSSNIAYDSKADTTDEKDIKINQLESKINNMESLLKNIYEEMHPKEQKEAQIISKDRQKADHNPLQTVYNTLIKNEVDSELAKKIIGIAARRIEAEKGIDASACVYDIIIDMIGKSDSIRLRHDGMPTVIVFVGPTGVGKTTTLAKIAANYALNNRLKVALITADTYRIAAVDQLKTYAEIIGIPISVIYSINEISEAIDSFSDKDLILIDTAGRSYKNKTQFDELKALVEATNADETFLVLSATTSFKNCREILTNYQFLKNYKLIFTKLDETDFNGIILNTRHLTNKSISYVTTGQSVPDDIEVASMDKIAKNIMGSIT